MSAFRADLPGLAELVARLGAFEQRADSLASDLDLQVQRLHGEWTGAAAAEHQTAHERWRVAAARMREASGELRRVVSTAHGNYSAAVSANLRMWG